MKIHELKIKEEYYRAIIDGNKTFELRKNDRDYREGDLIQFNDDLFSPEKISNYYITEKYYPQPSETLFQITYILKDVSYGLDKDYCILGIKQVEIKEVER